MLTYSLYDFNRELNSQIQKTLWHQWHSFLSSDPAGAGWMESSSTSSFVCSLEGRKFFLEVWIKDLLTFRYFSSWMHPLATCLLCRNRVAHPAPASASLAATFQEKLWSGCIKWGRGLRLWNLVSQSCLSRQNSNTHFGLDKRLCLRCSPFVVLVGQLIHPSPQHAGFFLQSA